MEREGRKFLEMSPHLSEPTPKVGSLSECGVMRGCLLEVRLDDIGSVDGSLRDS